MFKNNSYVWKFVVWILIFIICLNVKNKGVNVDAEKIDFVLRKYKKAHNPNEVQRFDGTKKISPIPKKREIRQYENLTFYNDQYHCGSDKRNRETNWKLDNNNNRQIVHGFKNEKSSEKNIKFIKHTNSYDKTDNFSKANYFKPQNGIDYFDNNKNESNNIKSMVINRGKKYISNYIRCFRH